MSFWPTKYYTPRIFRLATYSISYQEIVRRPLKPTTKPLNLPHALGATLGLNDYPFPLGTDQVRLRHVGCETLSRPLVAICIHTSRSRNNSTLGVLPISVRLGSDRRAAFWAAG